MNYVIREIEKSEIVLLQDFLYEAIYVPEGSRKPDKSIIELPELQIYIEDFGARADDYCLVAEVEGEIAGAVWVRIIDDYGHIDDETPSLSISLYEEYRGYGLGTQMMKEMIDRLRNYEYEKLSLSVQKSNYAAEIYKGLGFTVYDENEEEYIMIFHL